MSKVARSISLEDWEEKTKLSEKQNQSVYELQNACAELPLPPNWYIQDKMAGSPIATPGFQTPEQSTYTSGPVNPHFLASRLLGSDSIKRTLSTANLLAEATAADTAAEKQMANEIGYRKPIDTLQEFFDWFTAVETEMERGQEDVYQNHLSTVLLYQNVCEEFLEDLKATCQLFDDLKENYSFVDLRTRSIQEACETLLKEQERLTHVADGLSSRLAYFNQLESVVKLFNSPGEDICLKPEFIPMLDKLDECINYMQEHPEFRDAELYHMRFRQCMTRGITLIKMYVVSTIKKLTQDIYNEIRDKNKKNAALSTGKHIIMLYVKFNTIAPTIKSLTAQVEKRCVQKEYQSIYDEMLYNYFRSRQQLLNPLITKKLQDLKKNETDLLTFVKDSCAYMMGLCSDEYNLFYNFFQKSSEQKLYNYLDQLTRHLYNHLRPRIIHENNTTILSELCNVFLMYVMQDENDSVLGITEDANEVKFGPLIRNILEDTQARLSYLT
ncbi:Sec34-like family-domain-containing protein [Mycotypha africana]|uniref:Sec34-like family-domain-containing protein n=1 Tax=Mycotypha africana TaxID=64632 RepID=UPI002300C72C|nr:Sec34-like family-domain-containing protein [Mycotypha africana]KAI8973751.1 Sec34-like family-domain-containing protein [Mycotypha africana]